MNSKRNKSKPDIEFYIPETGSNKELSFYTTTVSAGFPSPAEDFIDKRLDLNDYLIKNQAATFLVKVNGDSMINAGILAGDILVVDRSLEPTDGRW